MPQSLEQMLRRPAHQRLPRRQPVPQGGSYGRTQWLPSRTGGVGGFPAGNARSTFDTAINERINRNPLQDMYPAASGGLPAPTEMAPGGNQASFEMAQRPGPMSSVFQPAKPAGMRRWKNPYTGAPFSTDMLAPRVNVSGELDPSQFRTAAPSAVGGFPARTARSTFDLSPAERDKAIYDMAPEGAFGRGLYRQGIENPVSPAAQMLRNAGRGGPQMLPSDYVAGARSAWDHYTGGDKHFTNMSGLGQLPSTGGGMRVHPMLPGSVGTPAAQPQSRYAQYHDQMQDLARLGQATPEQLAQMKGLRRYLHETEGFPYAEITQGPIDPQLRESIKQKGLDRRQARLDAGIGTPEDMAARQALVQQNAREQQIARQARMIEGSEMRGYGPRISPMAAALGTMQNSGMDPNSPMAAGLMFGHQGYGAAMEGATRQSIAQMERTGGLDAAALQAAVEMSSTTGRPLTDTYPEARGVLEGGGGAAQTGGPLESLVSGEPVTGTAVDAAVRRANGDIQSLIDANYQPRDIELSLRRMLETETDPNRMATLHRSLETLRQIKFKLDSERNRGMGLNPPGQFGFRAGGIM